MLLKDKIVSKPRETSGSNSSNRFDYQKDWSLCKLIEQHKSNSDYIVVFDWHEDLIIMDSEHNPTNISFYQIKGKKSGNWSVDSLIKSQSDKNNNPLLSIIGKLYDCKLKYDTETTSLNFVSNARFKTTLADNTSSLSKDEICIIELSNEEITKIKNKIKREHDLKTDPVFEDITFLKVIDLSLDDSKTHTQGKITDFFESIYPGKKLNAPTIYRLLFDEVKRRANYNKDILTYYDLITNKAIGKSQFENIIESAGIVKDYDDIWNRAENLLNNDGLSFHDSQLLKQEWKKLEIEKMNPANDYLNNLIEQIQSLVNFNKNNDSMKSLNLLEYMNNIYKEFNDSNTKLLRYNNNFVKAIILLLIYD